MVPFPIDPDESPILEETDETFTSGLVAGVSGFRGEPTNNPSAALLAAWTDAPIFVWLLTEDSLSEYLEVRQGENSRA